VFRDFNPATMTVEEWGEIEYARMIETQTLQVCSVYIHIRVLHIYVYLDICRHMYVCIHIYIWGKIEYPRMIETQTLQVCSVCIYVDICRHVYIYICIYIWGEIEYARMIEA